MRSTLMTNGEVKIKGFSVGVIAGAFDGLKAVQKGTRTSPTTIPATR